MTGRFRHRTFDVSTRFDIVHQFVVDGYDLSVRSREVDLGSLETLEAAVAWCRDQFGPPDGQRWVSHLVLREITFRDRLDAAAFKLVWV